MLQKSDLIAIARGKREISMTGFGGAPDGRTLFKDGELNFFPAIIDAAEGRPVTISAASGNGNYNAKYIQQPTKKVALATVGNGQMLVTDQLTGCIWQIWKCGTEIAGAHAYKGVGEAISIKNEAKKPKWELLDEYPTAGLFEPGEQGFAFSLVAPDAVETVIMAVKNGRTTREIKVATVFRQG